MGRVDSNVGIETGGSTGIGDGIIGIGTDCNVVGVDADCMAVGVGADDGGTDGSRIGMDVETGIDVGGSGSSVNVDSIGVDTNGSPNGGGFGASVGAGEVTIDAIIGGIDSVCKSPVSVGLGDTG